MTEKICTLTIIGPDDKYKIEVDHDKEEHEEWLDWNDLERQL